MTVTSTDANFSHFTCWPKCQAVLRFLLNLNLSFLRKEAGFSLRLGVAGEYCEVTGGLL